MSDLSPHVLAATLGLAVGVVLGLAGRLGKFCTLGALETAVWGGDQRRLRMWGIVLGVAISGTWAGAALGLIAPFETIYHQFSWNPWASITGGLLFGYGMAWAGNCGYGALVRLGGGDLRALVVVVVMAIAAYATLAGPLAPLRVQLFPQSSAVVPQGLPALTGHATVVVALALAGALLLWALAYEPLRRAPDMIAWAVAVGLSTTVALAGTTALAELSLNAVAVEGPAFTVAPGRALLWLMTSTAGGLGFSVGLVVGVLGGGFAGSLWHGRFRWEACEDPRELGRQVAGAVLMGIGGVLAMGCTLGQGVTAMAVLAWSAPVTLAAIAAGAALGLRRLIGAAEPQ